MRERAGWVGDGMGGRGRQETWNKLGDCDHGDNKRNGCCCVI